MTKSDSDINSNGGQAEAYPPFEFYCLVVVDTTREDDIEGVRCATDDDLA